MTGSELSDFSYRLKSIIDTAIDGIITINAYGVIESINRSALNLFQYDEEEVLGKNVNILMPSPHKENHNTYIHSYLDTRQPKIIGTGREVYGCKKDGTLFPFRLAVSEVILNDRVIFTGIVHDLTDLKAAQENILRLNKDLEHKVNERTYELENVVNEMLKANSRLKEEITEREIAEEKLRNREIELEKSLAKEKELGELKSRFVSMASHEFRTPLSTILSSAALISKYPETGQQEKREKHIIRIKNAVKNLTGILNDFLSLSKLEEGIINIAPEDINFDELCSEVFDELQVIMKPDQNLIQESKGQKKKLFHDLRMLKNILFNLISNAIKYSNSDGIIECNVEYGDTDLMVEIKDYGIGIPEEDKKYMFQRFFRAGNVTNIQGTGLGLTIVKRYIEIIGGDINFASKFGEGTSFIIKIPYNVNKDQ